VVEVGAPGVLPADRDRVASTRRPAPVSTRDLPRALCRCPPRATVPLVRCLLPDLRHRPRNHLCDPCRARRLVPCGG